MLADLLGSYDELNTPVKVSEDQRDLRDNGTVLPKSAVTADLNEVPDSPVRNGTTGLSGLQEISPELRLCLDRITGVTTPPEVVAVVLEFCEQTSTPTERKIIDDVATKQVGCSLWGIELPRNIDSEVREWTKILNEARDARRLPVSAATVLHQLPTGQISRSEYLTAIQ